MVVRLLRAGSVLLMTSLAISLLANYLLWGYWISRPSLIGYLDEADDLKGISVVSIDTSDAPSLLSSRDYRLDAYVSFCTYSRNLCLEGRLAQRVRDIWGDLAPASELGDRALAAIESVHLVGESSPVLGVAVHYIRGNSEEVLVAYRSGELTNDRFQFAESLIQLGAQSPPFLQAQVDYFFEISGLEDVTWTLLWPVMFVFFGALWLLISASGRIWTAS